MFVDNLESAPGTVAQGRASAQELIRLAKRRDVALVLVGHVTKDGQIAGPRVLEHMVDTVLYFEGERSHQYRVLRAVKNRFGGRSEEHTSELQSLMRISYAVFCLKKKKQHKLNTTRIKKYPTSQKIQQVTYMHA